MALENPPIEITEGYIARHRMKKQGTAARVCERSAARPSCRRGVKHARRRGENPRACRGDPQ